MEILIFETNVRTSEDVIFVKSLFTEISGITGWCVDLEDEDRILRVESINVPPKAIENLLREEGFRCQHLLY